MSGATIAAALPLISETFSDHPDAAYLSQLALTIPALFIAICSPLAGWLIDRLGAAAAILFRPGALRDRGYGRWACDQSGTIAGQPGGAGHHNQVGSLGDAINNLLHGRKKFPYPVLGARVTHNGFLIPVIGISGRT